eukprot:COSAG06_NODE_7783_length_2378_cov_1.742870_5_plen_82_part_00
MSGKTLLSLPSMLLETLFCMFSATVLEMRSPFKNGKTKQAFAERGVEKEMLCSVFLQVAKKTFIANSSSSSIFDAARRIAG